jgi:hypothetical protein
MHCFQLLALGKRRWLVLFVVAVCVVLGVLTLSAQYVGGTVGKYVTWVVVTVVDFWAIRVFVFLLPVAQSSKSNFHFYCFILVSSSSMVGCWLVMTVLTTLPFLAFELYLPVSSY